MTSIGAITDVALDRIAGLVRTMLGVPVGLVSLVDRQGQVFPGAAGLPSPWNETRRTPLTHSFCQYVVLTAAPLVVSDAREHPVLQSNLAIRDIGVVAYAGIPLVDLDGEVVGSLCAIDTEPRTWTPAEIDLLSDLAATCSAELQLRAAAAAATDAQGRTSALLELSETLSTTSTVADVSQAVSRLAIARLGAAFAGTNVLDAERRTLTYVDLSDLPSSVVTKYHSFPLSRHTPSATAVNTGRAVMYTEVEEMARDYPQVVRDLDDAQLRSCAYLPLQSGERVIGTLAVLWTDPQGFGAADRALLDGLARYTAQAIERALLLAGQRAVAETLQTALLPTLPDLDSVELSARYLPAHTANAVGGDWFDAFELPDRTLVLSVGDVQGHDIDAAAVMGQLRSTLRSLVVGMPGTPAQVLENVDLVLAQLPVGRFATAILATLTQEAGGARFTWSNAGHFAPLLLEPGGAGRFLASAPESPLGLLLRTRPRNSHAVDLSPGATLLMFTDGLVDRRDAEFDDLLQELCHSAGRHSDLPLPELIDSVLADLHAVEHADDIVVLGLRVPGPAAPGEA